jgi:hypothetical protein
VGALGGKLDNTVRAEALKVLRALSLKLNSSLCVSTDDEHHLFGAGDSRTGRFDLGSGG